MENSIEGFLIKGSQNLVEVYTTGMELIITFYSRTGTIAVHKQMNIETLSVIIHIIMQHHEQSKKDH